MNAIKAAAILALCTSLAGLSVLCYELFENVVLLRADIDAFNGGDHNRLLEYGLPGGIALVFLILALVLFGMSNVASRESRRS